MIKSITGKCVPHARGDGSTAADADAFIQGAPDAAAASGTYDKGLAKGEMRQIAITIAPVLLRRVDETAARTGQARAAIISMAIWRALAGDVFQWQIICEALSFNVQRKYKRDE